MDMDMKSDKIESSTTVANQVDALVMLGLPTVSEMAKSRIYKCKEAAYGEGTNASNNLEGDFGEWDDWEKVLIAFAGDVLAAVTEDGGEVVQLVKQSAWWRMNAAMKDALDNSVELSGQYEASIGERPASKKEKAIRSMYEREIGELRDLITYSDKNNGVPF